MFGSRYFAARHWLAWFFRPLASITGPPRTASVTPVLSADLSASRHCSAEASRFVEVYAHG